MSNTRYLEITSRYRDRTEYPQPANFVAEISQTGQQPREYAKDPVCDSAPLLYWNNSFQETTASSSSQTDLAVSTIATSDRTILQITATSGGIRQVNNFYNGAILSISVNSVVVQRRIIKYTFLSLTDAIITLDSALPDGGAINTGIITNPSTPSDTTTANSVIKFFIPTGSDIDNYYNNYIIDLVDSSGAIADTNVIISYDGTTRLATLATSTTLGVNWLNTSNLNFVIRKASTETGTLRTVSSDGTVLNLAITSILSNNIYQSSYIRMLEPVPTGSPGFSTEVAPYAEERRIIKYIGESGTFAVASGAGVNTFTFSNSASSVDNYYVGAFINTGALTGQVATYTGSTRSGTLTANWGGGGVSAGDTWTIQSAFLQSAFSTNPVVTGADTYEIEMFSRDNWTPFAYNGSLVSSQEAVCYELELINLILPNSTLVTGGRVAFYPYLYVELENISSSTSRTSTLIYSNNPNSNKMLFRAAIDDTPTPLISPYIKIDGDGMVQTVKFKPNDSFRFSVRLPNGSVFETVASDTSAPHEPNPLVQISALFSMKKL